MGENVLESYHVHVLFFNNDEDITKAVQLWQKVKELSVNGIIDNEVRILEAFLLSSVIDNCILSTGRKNIHFTSWSTYSTELSNMDTESFIRINHQLALFQQRNFLLLHSSIDP